MMRAGLCLAAFSSATTNLTRTRSPRLKLVIRGVFWVVPKVRQHRISAFVESDQIGGRQLVGKIVLQARLDGLPHVFPNRLIALRRRDVNTAPGLAWNINAQPRSTLLGSRHRVFQPPTPHWHKYVNVSMWQGCGRSSTRSAAVCRASRSRPDARPERGAR